MSKAAIVPGTETCGCCEGIDAGTPRGIDNRMGLSAIAFRSGEYEQFRHQIPMTVFLLFCVGLTVISFTKRLSLLPVLGLLTNLYLMTQLGGASNEKAKRELGWTPKHPSWRDGFKKALA